MAEKEGHDYTIGRELYTAPDLFVFQSDLKTFQKGNKENEYRCFDKFHVTDIQYDGRTIVQVSVMNDNNGKVSIFGQTPKVTHATQASRPPEDPPVSQANIEALKKAAERKGLDISMVLAMAGVHTH